jgi:hypothetical protein
MKNNNNNLKYNVSNMVSGGKNYHVFFAHILFIIVNVDGQIF